MQKTGTLVFKFPKPTQHSRSIQHIHLRKKLLPLTFIWTWDAKRCLSLDSSRHDTLFSLLPHKMVCYRTWGLCVMCLQGRVGINREIRSLFHSFLLSTPHINHPDGFWQWSSNDSGMVISSWVLQARGGAKEETRYECCQMYLPFIIPANRG